MKRNIYNFLHIFRSLEKKSFKNYLSAIFTQGMLSLTNFMIGFSLARYSTKSDYGLYVILYSIIVMVGNYQNALVNSPLTVLSPQKNEKEKISFLSGLGFGQWLFFIPFITLTLIVFSVYSFFSQNYILLKYIFILSFATSTFLFREFIRTINYSKLRINLL